MDDECPRLTVGRKDRVGAHESVIDRHHRCVRRELGHPGGIMNRHGVTMGIGWELGRHSTTRARRRRHEARHGCADEDARADRPSSPISGARHRPVERRPPYRTSWRVGLEIRSSPEWVEGPTLAAQLKEATRRWRPSGIGARHRRLPRPPALVASDPSPLAGVWDGTAAIQNGDMAICPLDEAIGAPRSDGFPGTAAIRISPPAF